MQYSSFYGKAIHIDYNDCTPKFHFMRSIFEKNDSPVLTTESDQLYTDIDRTLSSPASHNAIDDERVTSAPSPARILQPTLFEKMIVRPTTFSSYAFYAC